jgi:N-methylhydantoinase A/oxoprolinase/acetone carboxylase beta subunit
VGGNYLSGAATGYVVDIGGTTTDLASVVDGAVTFKEEGISIEGFRTAVRTVDVHTFGLGGDSYVQLSRSRAVQVGPRRVVPLSFLAHHWPRILPELQSTAEPRGDHELVQPADFFLFQKDSVISDLLSQEITILQALKEQGPLSRRRLTEITGALGMSLLRTDRLETHGSIIRCGLTPTDLLHVKEHLDLWNGEAALAAAGLYAARAGVTVERFIDRALDEFHRCLLHHMLAFVFRDEAGMEHGEQVARSVSGHLFSRQEHFSIGVRLNRPFVFIGAPAHAYAETIRRYVNIDLRVPEFNQVANAVGAICGAVRESLAILIRPTEDGRYVAYTPDRKVHFSSLETAKKRISELAGDLVAERAREAGAGDINVQIKVEDKTVDLSDEDRVYLETIVYAAVSSVPVMK